MSDDEEEDAIAAQITHLTALVRARRLELRRTLYGLRHHGCTPEDIRHVLEYSRRVAELCRAMRHRLRVLRHVH